MSSPSVVPPKQQRSEKTLSRILAAVERLIEEGGFRRATILEICREAQCSVGSFYARFEDKEAAFHYLHERMCDRARGFSAQMLDPDHWDGVRLEEILNRYLRLLTRNYTKNRGLLRAGLLFGEETGSKQFAARSLQVEQAGADLTRRLFSEYSKEIARPAGEAARIFQQIVRGVLLSEVLFSTTLQDEEELASSLSDMVFVVLGIDRRFMSP